MASASRAHFAHLRLRLAWAAEMRPSRPGGLAQLSAGLWLSATELETWGLLRAVQSLSQGIFFDRFVEAAFPVYGHQANSSAPAGHQKAFRADDDVDQET
jgi:hypothetical protein